jgi:hypothetical protein
MTIPSTLIVARNGRDALRLKPEPGGWSQSGTFDVRHYAALRESDEVAVGMFSVFVPGASSRMLDTGYLGLPIRREQNPLDIVAECLMCDYLDSLPGRFPPEGRVTLQCSPEELEALRSRERAADEVALSYLVGKTYWAYKYRQHYAVITYPDQLRLGFPIADLQLLADAYAGQRWTYYSEPQHDGFALMATQDLKQAGPRLMGRAVSGPIFDVLDSLSEQRYRAAATQLGKAYGFLRAKNPDYANAAKEAVAALESIARVITGASTLGRAIMELEQQKRIDSPTAKALGALYEYRSRTPGVGHGGKTPPSTEIAEARLIVNLCASASLYLLELDT